MLERAITEYGLTLALLAWFGYKDCWPLVRDWFAPTAAKERRAAAREAEQGRRDVERKREDRVFAAFENNTAAIVGLQTTIAHVNERLGEQSQAIMDINEDVAGLYGHIKQVRPSRVKKKEETT